MGMAAAKQGDKIEAMDVHLNQEGSEPPVPTPRHPFKGIIGGNRDGSLSSNVNIMGRAAATTGSTAKNDPEHKPIRGTEFPEVLKILKKPTNLGTIQTGSRTVFINRKPAARNGDKALTCNDPKDLPEGTVVATGTVMIG